jgi:hypothetical protein
MKKIYRVEWKAPHSGGQFMIAVDDFSQIGKLILESLWPPLECPTVITQIELLDPEAYFK